MCKMCLLVVYVSCLVLLCAADRDEELNAMFDIDREHYIDHSDFLGKDTKGSGNSPVKENPCPQVDGMELAELKRSNAELLLEIAKLSKELSLLKEHKSRPAEYPFLRRYAGQLRSRFDQASSDSDSTHQVNLYASLRSRDLSTLEKFTSGEMSDVAEIDELLTNSLHAGQVDYAPVMHRIDLMHYVDNLLNFKLWFILLVVCILMLMWWALLQGWNCYHLAGLGAFLTFTLAVVWHWHHLYLVEVARRQSDLEKRATTTLPSHCQPHKLSHFQQVYMSVNSFLGRVDDCEQYFQDTLIDPIWTVSPVLAISETLATFFLHPLGQCGTVLGSFFTNLLQRLPAQYVVPVMIVVVLLLIFLMLMLFGYEINFPLWMGGLAPSYRPAPAPAAPPVYQEREGRAANIQPQLPAINIILPPQAQHSDQHIQSLVRQYMQHQPLPIQETSGQHPIAVQTVEPVQSSRGQTPTAYQQTTEAVIGPPTQRVEAVSMKPSTAPEVIPTDYHKPTEAADAITPLAAGDDTEGLRRRAVHTTACSQTAHIETEQPIRVDCLKTSEKEILMETENKEIIRHEIEHEQNAGDCVVKQQDTRICSPMEAAESHPGDLEGMSVDPTHQEDVREITRRTEDINIAEERWLDEDLPINETSLKDQIKEIFSDIECTSNENSVISNMSMESQGDFLEKLKQLE